MTGLIARLAEHARQRPHHAAVVAPAGSLDYRTLLARVEAGAAFLSAQGLGADSVVGLTIDDELEHLVATLALLRLGTRQIVLATHDAEPLRARIAARVGVTCRLLGSRDADTAAGTAVLRWPGADLPPAPAPQGTPAGGRLYLKTSGTTGDMNIVAFDEAQLAAQAERHADYRDERLLRVASIEHNNSKRHRLYCVWAGGSNVFRPESGELVDFALRERVSCLDISRMHAADLAATPGAERLAGLKLRTGGSAVPQGVRRAVLERVTPALYVRYAATECGAIAMALPGEHDADEVAGRPLPGVELEVVDAEERPQPPGCGGAIRLRAPGMAEGYLDNPQQTAQRFRDGWFYPGDMGLLRSDGRLVVLGRQDDMIVLNGLNIFPAEIERVLEAHPGVAEAAAFPWPSVVHGQIPVAAVVLRPGADVGSAELQRHAREHLGLRAPRRVLMLEQLPRNPQGKTMKTALAAMLPAAAERSTA